MQNDINTLKQAVTDFIEERDWKQFHNPKDVSQALSIEAAELSELFLWISQENSYKVVEEKREAVADEMADVLAYLLAMSDATGIDLEAALLAKIEKNKLKYPIEKSKGKSTKYTDL